MGCVLCVKLRYNFKSNCMNNIALTRYGLRNNETKSEREEKKKEYDEEESKLPNESEEPLLCDLEVFVIEQRTNEIRERTPIANWLGTEHQWNN